MPQHLPNQHLPLQQPMHKLPLTLPHMYILFYLHTMHQLHIHILQQPMLLNVSFNNPTLQLHMQIM